MKIILAIVVVLVVLAGGAYFLLGKNLYTQPTTSTTQTSKSSNEVNIQNFAFTPSNLTVKSGTKVTWVNKDAVAHSATSNDGSFNTGTISSGASASFTFTKPGTYSYYCSFHPQMKATITVTP